MANTTGLTPPWQPGESGNPNGRPKGSRSLSTIVREILEENFDWNKTGIKNAKAMQEKYGRRGWDAIVYVAATKAVAGDVPAMKFLKESGYGNQLDLTSGGEKIEPIQIYLPSKNEDLDVDNSPCA